MHDQVQSPAVTHADAHTETVASLLLGLHRAAWLKLSCHRAMVSLRLLSLCLLLEVGRQGDS